MDVPFSPFCQVVVFVVIVNSMCLEEIVDVSVIHGISHGIHKYYFFTGVILVIASQGYVDKYVKM